MACEGIDTLRGLRVTATGWVHLDGEHIARRDLRRRLEARGAIWHEEAQLTTDVVILGELRDYQRQDDRVGGVDAIEQVYRSREERIHIHLVRDTDLAALLSDERVPCRRIPRQWLEMKKRPRASIRRGHL